MSGATYFVQDCPTCGRRLEVRVEYLGRTVKCRHCNGRFEATDRRSNISLSDSNLLDRVNELLATGPEQSRIRPR